MDDVDAEYYAGGLREIAERAYIDPETEMYLKAAAVFIERQCKVIAALSLLTETPMDRS
jgi:hypothetical protein